MVRNWIYLNDLSKKNWNRNLSRTGIFREFWHPIFPVRQLAAQWVLFSQCLVWSSSIRPGKPVLVDPAERVLMPLQIHFKVSEEFGSVSVYEGMVSWLLLYQCICSPSNDVTHPGSAHSHQYNQKTAVYCVWRATIWTLLCQIFLLPTSF